MNKLKNKKRLIIAGAAAGILLVILSFIIPNGEKTSESIEYYSTKLEEKVKTLVSSVDGVSDVSVMVTLDSGTEKVYAQNTEKTEERTVCDYAVISGDGTGALELKEIYPRVRGVAVVCAGGDSPEIQEKLISLLTSALGISSNRITVCG